MPNIDLSILNQRQTPAFYADVFANRPAAGYVGRIFVSTDTFAFYRDNGTGWDLIGGPGTGTVTGTGANGQVTFWNGASTITGSNDLFWDATNGHLGVNTNAPGTALDVHHDQNTVAILNQTVATNDVRIGFQNNGVGLWRIGAFYNAGANDFGIFDAVGNIQPVTVKKTTGQVLIGTSTVGSGKLVVASATGDNGIQIVGATAPSLRIDSAESGPTKRVGLGLATAVNNFIQGSVDRDFCMFNGSTTASPILFGIYNSVAGNVQEAARISATRNFLIGTTTDNSKKLQVNGDMSASAYYVPSSAIGGGFIFDLSGNCGIGIGQSSNILQFYSGGSERMRLDNSGNFGIGTIAPLYKLTVLDGGGASIVVGATTGNAYLYADDSAATIGTITSTPLRIATNSTERARFSSSGNLLIGTTTDNGEKLQVAGNITARNSTNGDVRLFANNSDNGTSARSFVYASTTGNRYIGLLSYGANATGTICGLSAAGLQVLDAGSDSNALLIQTGISSVPLVFGTNNVERMRIKSTGVINISGIPTSAVGLVSGDIYSNAGILTIVP